MIMMIRWFLSGTVRHAMEMRKHVQKLLNAERDLLPPAAISGLSEAVASMTATLNSNPPVEALQKEMGSLEKAATKWLKPYPHPAWRENVEVLLVAIAVAMGIRTFFLQPFKIPTGSMQPTLYGVMPEDLRGRPDILIPTGFKRITDAMVHGTFYHRQVAEDDGVIEEIGPPEHMLRFINKQSIRVRYDGRPNPTAYSFWFTPDDRFEETAGISTGRRFSKGEDIVKLKEITGDHLFVDRVTYNFRRPERGEIIVFKTKGIMHPQMRQDQFYIKRLVALGNERVRIGDDRHLRINETRLDASTPHFESVYNFDPVRDEPQRNHYSGHVNDRVLPGIAPLFRNAKDEAVVRHNHYMVMGDNTMNSSDSRTWGDFPRENVIGKSYFVYWPISKRFGWGYR